MTLIRFRNVLFVLCGLCTFASCSSQNSLPADSFEQSVLRSRDLRSRYGEIRDPRIEAYDHYICWRLSKAFQRVQRGTLSNHQCEIVVLNERAPLAFSLGSGKVAVSKGLIMRMRNEAEFAFVLAHEISHDHLGHESEIFAVGDYLLEQERQTELEFEADRFALGLIALAGYDPRASIQAIVSAYGIHDARPQAGTHPSVEERYKAAWHQFEESRWEPPEPWISEILES